MIQHLTHANKKTAPLNNKRQGGEMGPGMREGARNQGRMEGGGVSTSFISFASLFRFPFLCPIKKGGDWVGKSWYDRMR